MSLKCSIFGHRWGERTVEREREEQGSEVVSTEREIQTCQHCGDRRVVSENTEVTTLEPADGADGDPGAETTASEPAPGAVAGSARGDHVDGATDAEVIDDEATAEPPDAGSDEAAPASASGADGAPDEEAAAASDAASASTQTGDGGADDGVILDESEQQERQPGEWPEDADEVAEPEWARESSAAAADEDEPEYESAGPAVTVPEGEFHCPACGFTAAVESSSLRAGDFCPECQQGSLEHRAGEE